MISFIGAEFVGFTSRSDRSRCLCCALFTAILDDALCFRCREVHPNACKCQETPRAIVRLLEDAGFSHSDLLGMATTGAL